MVLSLFVRRIWRGHVARERRWRGIAYAFLAIFAVLTLLPSVVSAQQRTCDCVCQNSEGTVENDGPDCSDSTECSFTACRDYCTRLGGGFQPGVNRGFVCRNRGTEPGTSAPATGGTSGGSTGASAPAPSSGTDAPAPAPSGEATATSTSSGGGSSGGALRFVLPSCTSDGNCSLTDIINTGIRFANFLVGLSGIAFLGIFLYAGANIILFANDAGSFKQAKSMLQGAVVGVVIVMIAGVAVRFVSSSLGVNQSFLRTPGASTRSTPTPPPASTPPASR
ncbi:MAG: hypothetical protein QG668_424 [Patescibacteria group bacterium]|nr:hypothetical protein [Patescibacteria group bacterium]